MNHSLFVIIGILLSSAFLFHVSYHDVRHNRLISLKVFYVYLMIAVVYIIISYEYIYSLLISIAFGFVGYLILSKTGFGKGDSMTIMILSCFNTILIGVFPIIIIVYMYSLVFFVAFNGYSKLLDIHFTRVPFTLVLFWIYLGLVFTHYIELMGWL